MTQQLFFKLSHREVVSLDMTQIKPRWVFPSLVLGPQSYPFYVLYPVEQVLSVLEVSSVARMDLQVLGPMAMIVVMQDLVDPGRERLRPRRGMEY